MANLLKYLVFRFVVFLSINHTFELLSMLVDSYLFFGEEHVASIMVMMLTIMLDSGRPSEAVGDQIFMVCP